MTLFDQKNYNQIDWLTREFCGRNARNICFQKSTVSATNKTTEKKNYKQ